MATLPAVTTTGNFIIAAVAWDNGGSNQPTIDDTAGNVYTLAATVQYPGLSQVKIFYARNIVGGSPTVTVTLSMFNAALTLIASEFSGLPPSTAPAASSTGTSAPAKTSAIDTGAFAVMAGDLVYAAEWHLCAATAPVVTAGSGNTVITTLDCSGVAGDPLGAEYRIAGTTGSESATFDVSPADNWAAAGVSFR
jgi:hypothetical protein